MIIEWLRFRVKEESREKFIHQDRLIWTEFLSTIPGFLGKEVWLEPKAPNTVVFVIRWRTRSAWKSIPRQDLKRIDDHFAAVMEILGIKYQSVGGAEYQIRKFPSP